MPGPTRVELPRRRTLRACDTLSHRLTIQSAAEFSNPAMVPNYLTSIHRDGSARYVQTQGNNPLHTGAEVTLRLRTAVNAPSVAFLRDTDLQQLLVIGNRGPGEHPAEGLFVRDGMTFTEIFTGQMLAVQNGYLPLPAGPMGIQLWQSGNP